MESDSESESERGRSRQRRGRGGGRSSSHTSATSVDSDALARSTKKKKRKKETNDEMHKRMSKRTDLLDAVLKSKSCLIMPCSVLFCNMLLTLCSKSSLVKYCSKSSLVKYSTDTQTETKYYHFVEENGEHVLKECTLEENEREGNAEILQLQSLDLKMYEVASATSSPQEAIRNMIPIANEMRSISTRLASIVPGGEWVASEYEELKKYRYIPPKQGKEIFDMPNEKKIGNKMHKSTYVVPLNKPLTAEDTLKAVRDLIEKNPSKFKMLIGGKKVVWAVPSSRDQEILDYHLYKPEGLAEAHANTRNKETILICSEGVMLLGARSVDG